MGERVTGREWGWVGERVNIIVAERVEGRGEDG